MAYRDCHVYPAKGTDLYRSHMLWDIMCLYSFQSSPHFPISRPFSCSSVAAALNGFFLFDCADKKLTSTMNADFLDLWKEDVVEIFLWTDESSPVYFEYEISPLDFELPLLISNENGELLRWQPFHYEPNRKTRHSTSVRGGEKKSMSKVSGWMAEFFIPYTLMRPLDNNIPKSGTKWRANMYRVDYDATPSSNWTWQPVNKTFHDYKKFGTFVFE
jgi:hypothetical protein